MAQPLNYTPEITHAGPEVALERVTDRQELAAFLHQDPIAHAYLLGNLDPAYFQFCKWYGLRDELGHLESLTLLYQGLSIPVVFMVGRTDRFGALASQSARVVPGRHHFHVHEGQIQHLKDYFEITSYTRMHRMGLSREHFAGAPTDARVERLGHRDTAAIMRLYEHFPDHFFEPYQLETGLYFGVRDARDGQLLAISGVHAVSEAHDVAVVGNLVTRPDMRGAGLATACTGQLLNELFERVSLVALNVQANNEPAIRMYTNFGFRPNNIFFEGRSAGIR